MKTTLNTTQFNHNLKSARLATLAALALITFVSAIAPGAAQEVKPRSPIAVANLAGTWQVAIELNGGCGVGSKRAKT